MLDFRILGPIEVERDEALVDLAGQRPRAALVLLLLQANHVVSAEQLIDALWGERPPPTASTALRNVITQLRKILGAETIETRPPGYVLRVARESFDLARFEAAVAAAHGKPARERADLLRRAASEWRGDPLSDLRYEPFLQNEIRRLEELRIAALEDLFDAELELGGAARVVPELESEIVRHPHRERLRGQLMLALYRTGRQADALQIYQDTRRLLAEELGLEPGPALRRLHTAILRQETDSDPPASPGERLPAVVEKLLAGRLVVVIGSPTDYAATLAERFGYAGTAIETPRVSQYAATTLGAGPLHDELRTIAEANAEPTAVHRFLATLPPLLRGRGLPHQLLVTTDYDGALERAFADAGEEVDVVAYLASGPHRGKFSHLAPDGSTRVIDVPVDYATELSLDRRTIVLRVRGRADPEPDRSWESFVVTEDDHIEYLRRADVAGQIPVALAATLRRNHFLFIGYDVHDWCLRLVLGCICAETPLPYRSWAVTSSPSPTDAEMWRQVGVDLVAGDPGAYVEALAGALADPTAAA